MKKVTFKEFFTTIGCGLWQAVRWVAGIFDYKDDSKFGIFIRRVFAGSLSLIVFAIAVIMMAFVYEFCKNRYINSAEEDDGAENTYVSRYVYYHDKGDGMGYIFNLYTGETLIKHVAWIAKPSVGDSLVCYSDGKKRGYFNAYTGKIAIEPSFEKAWIFSDGLAAVEKDGGIIFIDHAGRQVFNKSFEFSYNSDGYCFHDGYSIIAWGSCHFGVINKKGEWAIPPKYLDLHRAKNGYWVIKDKEGYGLMNDSMKMVLPCKYRYIDVEENDILVQNEDYSMQRLNEDLSVKDDFVFADVEQLFYNSDRVDKDGNPIVMAASCRAYKVDEGISDHYGLMDATGKPLTKPSFEEIDAVENDLYLCKIGNEGILLNGRGKKVN